MHSCLHPKYNCKIQLVFILWIELLLSSKHFKFLVLHIIHHMGAGPSSIFSELMNFYSVPNEQKYLNINLFNIGYPGFCLLCLHLFACRFITVKLSEIRKEVQCPICLGMSLCSCFTFFIILFC